MPPRIKEKTYPLHKSIQYSNVAKFKIMLLCNEDINEINNEGYPLLVLACEQDNNDEILELLINSDGIDPHLTNNKGFNALHCLALRGKLIWIKKLFNKFPVLEVDQLTNEEDTAFILASKRNNADVIKYLYDKGAKVDKQNKKGYTALQYAVSNGYIESTIDLIKMGADVNTKDIHGSTPIMKAIRWGFFEIGKILMENTADLQKINYSLHEAVECSNIKKVGILLPVVKDINEKNDIGDSPLILACQHANNEILELLIHCKNVDPNITNSDYFNALHWLAIKGNLDGIKKLFCKFPDLEVDRVTDNGDTALIFAAKMDHADVIEYLFEKGANVNHLNNRNFTALLYTANNGYVNSTLKLITLGADINVRDDFDFTPLIKAASWGFTEVCKILLENKAEVDAKNNIDFTALLLAIRRKRLDTVKLLLDHGADPNANRSKTYTPLTTACGHFDMFNLLVKYGADIHFPKPFSAALFYCVKTSSYDCAKVLLDMKVNVHTEDRRGNSAMKIARMQGDDRMIELLNSYM